ncbi:MAG: SsrA-binding protein SmpB [Deltaproteobacteria bacterium]|nr:SsrA-binding protein SmpB [Deltaproteobacteria bacterium]
MSIKIICQNKKAFHDYFVEETFEAGLVLVGTEVKSLRAGKAQLVDSYAVFQGEELFLLNAHISHYSHASRDNHDPTRTRKLLLNKKELQRLLGKTKERGLSIVPLKLYFSRGRVKVEIALVKGKKLHDKRETLKKKAMGKDMERELKDRSR